MHKFLESATEHIIKRFHAQNHTITAQKAIQYGIQLTLKKSGQTHNIQIYCNKKGKITIQKAFSPIPLPKETEAILDTLQKDFRHTDPQSPLPTEEDKSPNSEHSHSPQNTAIIGTDESGKGDYFGPLIIAAVLIPDAQTAKKLKSLHIRDSKQCSDAHCRQLAQKIAKICPHDIITISPSKYNEMHKLPLNLNGILAWGHARAIRNLLTKHSKHTVSEVIIDQFAHNTELLSQKLPQALKSTIKITQEHHAERHLPVASASILARAEFLQKLQQLREDFKTDFPKGANPKVIRIAKQFIATHGEAALEQVAKYHFKTTQNVFFGSL